MSFFCKVGKFAKSTGVAPASQPINGFGWAPVAGQFAMLLWSSGGTVDGTIQTQATLDARAFIGMVTGTAAAEHFAAATTADTAGNGGQRVSQKACLLTDATGATVTSQAVLASLDGDGVTLSWTTNAVGESQIIHYIAWGGTDVLAKVSSFDTPASGNYVSTDPGFQPNLLISTGSAAAALDTGVAATRLRIGMVTEGNVRGSVSYRTTQLVSGAAYRWQRSNRFTQQVSVVGTSNIPDLDLVTFDPTGYTLAEVSALGAIRTGVLALRVPGVAIGLTVKPTGGAPATHVVSGLPLTPIGVLLVSNQDIARGNPGTAPQTGARMGLSAFTAGAAESSVFSIPNAPNPFTFAYLEKTAKAAVKIDNATPAIDAEATGALDAQGFTLTWNANDAVATEYIYLAVGIPPVPKGTGRVTKRSHFANGGRKPRGAWRRRAT
jgi:hypothetical protein